MCFAVIVVCCCCCCLGFLAISLSLHLIYSLLALLFVYVCLPWFLRGQTQNLFQGIRLAISRVVTFTPATQTSAVSDKRLIVWIVHHCLHRSSLEDKNICTIFLTALNISIESIYMENCCRQFFFPQHHARFIWSKVILILWSFPYWKAPSADLKK